MSATSRKPVLVVVYNHNYPANIPKIEYLYSKRFSRIYHLMPFYFPDKSVDAELAKRIIPVFDSSYYFQGFMAAGYNTYRHEDASHYIFVADDLILNPEINEDNYADFFELNAKDSFVQNTHDITQPFGKEPWVFSFFAFTFNFHAPGLQETHKLPSVEEAIGKFKPLGYATQYVREKSGVSRLLFKASRKIATIFPRYVRYIEYFNKKYNFKLSYPFVSGWSDLTIVPHNKIDKFCHYCGIFAGLNLFVEIAIPTTLVLLQGEDELRIGPNSKYQVFEGWPIDLHPFNLNLPQNKKFKTLDDILAAFPREYLYIHPIKLSQLSH
ncbi:MAG: hypothetical protein K0U41_04365 [Gammaproteobacteria bacterium]|nr:hypothetical protein [Gammaproteobacteria bacterium]